MTIDHGIGHGIDLGTTNSAIAVLSGVDTEVVKNNDDAQTTPSAVWVDRRDRLFVGRVARERAELDPDNTCLEFKLRMGTAGIAKRFAATGREMTPEELSAEVLKSLRGDVAQRYGVTIDAAAVTVPAAFDMGACAATRRAAALAGLTTAPLLQEPAAAALAYGFQRDEDTRLLVYDLGGGTFDAAVVEVRDGEFSIVNHRGDTFLGGKLIDWRLVEDVLIPAATRQLGLDGLRRGDLRWAAAVGKLKLAAERAKIQLSRADSVDIAVELEDLAGKRLEFEHQLLRADVERLSEPYVARSVNLCRRALAEARLAPADIARVLLVGGPTLSPYLRERLTDPVEGLGIALDHSQDPLTVVARGAAIFAGTQRVADGAAPPPPAPHVFAVRLEYAPIGPDTEPFVAGRIEPPAGHDLRGHGVELVNAEARPPWRSGRVHLGADGVFSLTAFAERGRANTVRLELTSPTGAPLRVEPDSFAYTVGVVETSPPLTGSIGVGLDGEQMLWLFDRGMPLPARRRVRLRTTYPVRAGEQSGMIRIPVLEGEHRRADRNRRIGRLQVVADDVERDVPEGSEVEVVVEIDASRMVIASAYVPLLDREFTEVIDLGTEPVPPHAALLAQADDERRRLDAVRERQRERGSVAAGRLLDRIAAERVDAQVDELVAAAEADPDAATTGASRLVDLRAAVDAVEAALAWPDLVEEAESVMSGVAELAAQHGTAEERRSVRQHCDEARAAIEAEDDRLVEVHVQELRDLAYALLDRSDQMPVLIFDSLTARLAEMTDGPLARRLAEQGENAIARREIGRLRDVNRKLRALLPTPPPPPDPFSTVRPARR
jgi:molecular chaperone DnaK